MTKSDTEKLRRWEVWQRDDGTTYLTWGNKATPTDSEKLVSTFYSANWLSAEREAFGSDPEIDDGILPLVEVVHQFPGVMAMAACQGHPERGDDCAVIGLTFDDPLSLKTFAAALCQLAKLDPPVSWDLRLDEARTQDLPPEALAFELTLFDDHGVPSPSLLMAFSHSLLAVSGVAGLSAVPAFRKDPIVN